jgi:hypothetical protein
LIPIHRRKGASSLYILFIVREKKTGISRFFFLLTVVVMRQGKEKKEKKVTLTIFLLFPFLKHINHLLEHTQLVPDNMFWIFYMIFSIFRSHRNRFYWRNGKLHFVKQNLHQRRITPEEEQKAFRHNIRQWFIFYSILASIIVAILLHRLNKRQKLST